MFTFYRWTIEEQRIVCLRISQNVQSTSEDGRKHDNGDMRMLSLMSYEIRVSMTTPPNEATECKTCVSYRLIRSMCLQCARPCQEETTCQSSQPTIFENNSTYKKYELLYKKHDTAIFSKITTDLSIEVCNIPWDKLQRHTYRISKFAGVQNCVV